VGRVRNFEFLGIPEYKKACYHFSLNRIRASKMTVMTVWTDTFRVETESQMNFDRPASKESTYVK
jgi:hypothetical protein